MTAFTAKTTVVEVQKPDYNDHTKVRFTANYTNRAGERVNQEWAKYTPGFGLEMWLSDEFMAAHPELAAGADYTLTFTLDAPAEVPAAVSPDPDVED